MGELIAGYNDLTEKLKQVVNFEVISKLAKKYAFSGGIYILFIDIFLYLIFNV